MPDEAMPRWAVEAADKIPWERISTDNHAGMVRFRSLANVAQALLATRNAARRSVYEELADYFESHPPQASFSGKEAGELIRHILTHEPQEIEALKNGETR